MTAPSQVLSDLNALGVPRINATRDGLLLPPNEGGAASTLGLGGITQDAASRALMAADNGKTLVMTAAGATVYTVPAALPAGFSCRVVQGGAGAVTMTGSGATIANRQSFVKTAGQNAMISLHQTAVDAYVLTGDGAIA